MAEVWDDGLGNGIALTGSASIAGATGSAGATVLSGDTASAAPILTGAPVTQAAPLTGTFTSTIVLNTPSTQNPATLGTAGFVNVTNGDGILGTAGYAWTVTNLGTISLLGTTGNGIHLTAGGVVTNGQIGLAGPAITGPTTGVKIDGGPGTVNNFGRISAPTTSGVAVLLQAGGTVTNGASGAGAPLISGSYGGIYAGVGATTVINFGRIESPGSLFNGGRPANVGIFLGGGGYVRNGASNVTNAQIYGYHMGIFSGPLGSPITVANFGTIASSATHCNNGAGADGPEAGVGILLGAPSPVIINGASNVTTAVIDGYYRAIGAGYYGTATVTNWGTIASTQTALPVRYFGVAVVLHDGGRVTNYGVIEGVQNGVWSSVGNTFGLPGTITNLGTIGETAAFAVINGKNLAPIAVELFAGGVVTNGQSGLSKGVIAAGWDGVVLANQPGSVVNFGTIISTATISDPSGFSAAGVVLANGGTLVNGALAATTASIQAYETGVYIGGFEGTVTGASGVVFNYGSIQSGGTVSQAVRMASGGAITNHGLIGASGTGIALTNTAGTIDNFGRISSTPPPGFAGAAGIYLQKGGKIINEVGGSITATRAAISFGGNGATNAAATLLNSGTVSGGIAVSVGPSDSASNTIINFGSIIGTSGIAIHLGAGNDVVVIESGSTIVGAVSNFHPGDSFDLPFMTFSSTGTATLGAGNVLNIIENGGTFSIALDPAQNFSGETFHLIADAAGGTAVTVANTGRPADFDKDGTSDVLWRNNSSGDTGFWAIANNAIAGWRGFGQSPTTYSIVGIGDFNSDGTADVLWRNPSSGDTGYWTIANNVIAGWTDLGQAPLTYSVVGVGDFDADGTADVLWRNNSSGDTGFWRIANNTIAGWTGLGLSSTNYSVVGVGDFNGDGTSDVLWRNPTTGDTGYWAIANNAVAGWVGLGQAPTTYNVVGVGDFNGNGVSDILWRNGTTGDTGYWTIANNAISGWIGLGQAPTTYNVVGVGDFSGDGISDILWRNPTTGDTGYWTITNNRIAGWTDLGQAPTSYTVENAATSAGAEGNSPGAGATFAFADVSLPDGPAGTSAGLAASAPTFAGSSQIVTATTTSPPFSFADATGTLRAVAGAA